MDDTMEKREDNDYTPHPMEMVTTLMGLVGELEFP